VTFPNAAVAAASLADGKAWLEWALQCAQDLRLDNATTPVPLQPGQAEISGVAQLAFQAGPDALGMQTLPCVLRVRFVDTLGTSHLESTFPIGVVVEFVDALTVAALEPAKSSGPQKQMAFPLHVANGGNSRVAVQFDVERPSANGTPCCPQFSSSSPAPTTRPSSRR
jgi:hypothetical protein